jgi:hypothetical protein
MTLPAVDDFTATFGGAKVNYSPVEDPTTDEDAGTRNTYVADIAMATQTAIRSWCQFKGAATTGGMSVTQHAAVWGNTIAVVPVLARTTTGTYTITWPATITDALGVSQSVNFRTAWCNITDLTTGWDFNCAVTAANVVTVVTRNSTGTLTEATGLNIDVFTL